MVGIHEEQANVSGTMIIFMLIYVKMTCIYSSSLVDWSSFLFCVQIVANTLKSTPSVTKVSGNYGFTIQNRKKIIVS
jgi:hypothetical protein